jgi:hypothetical protein
MVWAKSNVLNKAAKEEHSAVVEITKIRAFHLLGQIPLDGIAIINAMKLMIDYGPQIQADGTSTGAELIDVDAPYRQH